MISLFTMHFFLFHFQRTINFNRKNLSTLCSTLDPTPHFVRLSKALTSYVICNLWLIQKPMKHISKTDKPLCMSKSSFLAGIGVYEGHPAEGTAETYALLLLFFCCLFVFFLKLRFSFSSSTLKVSRFLSDKRKVASGFILYQCVSN